MRIAIVGTGIAGLTCAHLLSSRHDVTVFERDARPGGHSNTVRVELEEESHAVDTGFIVYNERNYPGLVRLFSRLGVATKPSEMSFSVSDPERRLEWRSSSPATVFAQPRNVLRPSFLRMLAEVLRFNRYVRRRLRDGIAEHLSLEALLAEGRFEGELVRWYLVPMVSAIWSATPASALELPADTFARFFENHGLLELGAQPRWRTVEGGARTYVERILAPFGRRLRLDSPVRKVTRRRDGVELLTDGHGPEYFDHVVLAAHSDESLGLLGDPTASELEVLGAIRYQPNTAVLHTDETLLPRARRARASWNYRITEPPEAGGTGATVTYHMNRLQSIVSRHELCVTLNQPDAVDPERVLGVFEYAHPVSDGAAAAARRRYGEISGTRSTWYCGAYWGYGFHEDGVESALRVCRSFGVAL